MLKVKLHNKWYDHSSYCFLSKNNKDATIHLGMLRSYKRPFHLIFAHELAHYKLNQYYRNICHLHS